MSAQLFTSDLDALKWVVHTLGCELEPFEGMFDESAQITLWHCYGCDGEFISKWPRWEKPTIKTFGHNPDCKYVQVIKRIRGNAKKE